MTTATPGPTTTAVSTPRRPRRRPSFDRVARWSAALVVLGAVAVGIVRNEQYRAVEAFLASRLLEPFVDGTVGSAGSIYWISGAESIAFRITAECTGFILVAPLLLLAAVLLAVIRVSWWRTVVAVLAMTVTASAVNEVRLALIGFSTLQWGVDAGYTISHTFVGSVIGIVGFVAGLVVLLLIMLRGARRGRRAAR